MIIRRVGICQIPFWSGEITCQNSTFPSNMVRLFITCIKVTFVARGLVFERTSFLNYTVFPAKNVLGTARRWTDFRAVWSIFSYGISFFAVHRKVHNDDSVSPSTSSQCNGWSFCYSDRRDTALDILLVYRSFCPFSCG